MKKRFLSTLAFVVCALVLVGADSCRQRDDHGSTDETAGSADEGASDGQEAADQQSSPSWTGDSFTLRVRIAGLVAMVPAMSGKSLGLLMIDAGAPATASNGCIVPRHYPAIEWYAGACDGDSIELEHPCERSRRTLAYEDLQLQVLSHESSLAEPDLDLGGFSDPTVKPRGSHPTHDPARQRPGDLPPEWVVRSGELYPAGKVPAVNESCLREVPGIDCPVVARLRLDHGTLRTCRLTEIGETAKNRVPWTYGFRPLSGGPGPSNFSARTLGTISEVTWQVEGSGLRIVSWPFGDEEEGEVVTLKPSPSGEIILQFINLVDEDEHGEPQEGCDATKTDHHFEYFYSLAAEKPRRLHVPHGVSQVEEDIQPECGLVKPGIATKEAASPTPGDVTACAKKGYPASAGVETLRATGFDG
ncbi:MAG TPA: hypothetical protein VLF66_05370 [Thermoanaerobaculia bacterium]|nr:hypothetical protein [Thermoanaerobaculia bacterium]